MVQHFQIEDLPWYVPRYCPVFADDKSPDIAGKDSETDERRGEIKDIASVSTLLQCDAFGSYD
jgi:hypothetical protein